MQYRKMTKKEGIDYLKVERLVDQVIANLKEGVYDFFEGCSYINHRFHLHGEKVSLYDAKAHLRKIIVEREYRDIM